MTSPLLLLALFSALSLCFLLPLKVLDAGKSILLLIAVALLFFAGALQWTAVLALTLLALPMHIAAGERYPRALRLFAGAAATLGIFAITLDKVPGFITTRVVDNVFLGTADLPFSFILFFDEALVGMLLLVFWFDVERDYKVIGDKLLRSALPALLLVVLLLGLAICLGYNLDPKWYWFTPYFLLGNLCLAVIAEEVFFRGVIQQKLMNTLAQHTPYAGLIALLAVSMLFGLLHLGGGEIYAALAGLASVIYGWVYWHYRSIHAAILCHFSVNALHFVFLQYPG